LRGNYYYKIELYKPFIILPQCLKIRDYYCAVVDVEVVKPFYPSLLLVLVPQESRRRF